MTPDSLSGQTLRPPTAGMTTKVVKGSFWSLLGQIAPLVASLAATPFVLRLLDTESYGVVILMSLIPAYLTFADLGMGIASTRFASAAYAEGDTAKEAAIVRTAALIALIAAVPAGLAVFLFSEPLVEQFSVPSHLIATANTALKISAVTLVLNLLNNIFNTPQLTRLRMDLNTLVMSGFRVAGVIAMPFVLYFGGGIIGAVSVLLAASLLTLAGHIYISGRLLPALFERSIEREMIGPLLKFGIGLSVSGIAGILLINAEKGMLSAMLSPAALAYYSIAFQVMNMMTMFSGAMVQALIPAFSQLQGEGKRDQLNALYSRGIRMNMIWMVPACLFLGLAARPFLTLWAGEDFGRESIGPFYILLAGVTFNILAYFPTASIVAVGRTDVLAKLYWIEVGPYILMVWLLTLNFGIAGAAAAWSMRVIVDAVCMFYLAKRVAAVNYRHHNILPFLTGAGLMAVPFALVLYFQETTPAVIIVALIMTAAYAALTWKRVLTADEVSWLSERITMRLAKRSL